MTTKKLYIEAHDLKERYSSEFALGETCLRVYVESVEKSRKITITVAVKENGTVEFGFDVVDGHAEPGIESLNEAWKDIQGEVCAAGARRKYDKPPKFLPSVHIEHRQVSRETTKEMQKDDQRRLQRNLKGNSPLTIGALEDHDKKHTTGPSQLHQFGCPACHLSWWRHVIKTKPVSRCRGRVCGNERYDALPRDKEFGIGRCLCPNELCGREFFAYCQASETLKCRKCKSNCKPHIHPKWRKRVGKGLNPGAKSFKPRNRSRFTSREDLSPGPHFEPVSSLGIPYASPHSGDGVEGAMSALSMYDDPPRGGEANYGPSSPSSERKPRKRAGEKRRIFNASNKHIPRGGTVSTFLSQIDFELNGVEVDCDYDSDDDEENVGVCKFECDCGNEYTVLTRMLDQAKCYPCGKLNNPLRRVSEGDIERNPESANQHSCTRCNGRGNCPNLM